MALVVLASLALVALAQERREVLRLGLANSSSSSSLLLLLKLPSSSSSSDNELSAIFLLREVCAVVRRVDLATAFFFLLPLAFLPLFLGAHPSDDSFNSSSSSSTSSSPLSSSGLKSDPESFGSDGIGESAPSSAESKLSSASNSSWSWCSASAASSAFLRFAAFCACCCVVFLRRLATGAFFVRTLRL